MGLYGPSVTEAIEPYATQFDDLEIVEREPIVDLNAINPLSELREDWQNATNNQTEHKLSTSAGVDERAYLATDERGQYTAGYEAQAGMGVRVPQIPQNDEVLRWGYYTRDSNGDPLNGWYFGVDSTGVFVAEVRNGTVDKVYQDQWNVNIADGDDDAEDNPSGFNLDLAKGNIFQIEFVYYGYGPAVFSVLTDQGKLVLHRFTHDGSTSVENTNLPLTIDIDSGGTNSDAMDLFVGGRQFSIIGEESSANRRAGHYVDSISVDDTKWYAVCSIQLKDGSDIGSIDFRHVLANILRFSADTDATSYRWQVRRGTTPDNPVWETPESHIDKPDETAMKVDTNSADVQDGSGNLTGVFIDGGTLEGGKKNETDIQRNDPSGQISDGEVATLLIQAQPGASGTVSEIFFSWNERW